MSKDIGMPHERTPMVVMLECLKANGYDKEFHISKMGLICLDNREILQPEDLIIVDHERFEGISDPDDMAMLYVVETKSGLKGVIIAAFGVYGNADLYSFMNKVEDKTLNNLYKNYMCEIEGAN